MEFLMIKVFKISMQDLEIYGRSCYKNGVVHGFIAGATSVCLGVWLGYLMK
jgi:hypothetical protein